MTEYVVFIPGDEDAWEASSPEQRVLVYARHEEFARQLAARGHVVKGGAELAHSRSATIVQRSPDGSVIVSDGPYAEAAEQITGYYLVESDDLKDLAEVCGILAGVESGVEIRAVVKS
jgi:hypothetical protein